MSGQADIINNLKRIRQGDRERTDPHLPEPPPTQPALRTRGAGQGVILLVELFSGICTATFALQSMGVDKVVMAADWELGWVILNMLLKDSI